MLTKKQEDFTLNIYKGQTEHDAWGNAGYSTNYSPEVIYVNACRLANSTKVKLRLAELRQVEAVEAVATVQERKEKLTEVIRVRLPDKVTAKERVMATDTMNKMEKIYAIVDPGYIDNRTINIIVSSERAKELTERVSKRFREEEDGQDS